MPIPAEKIQTTHNDEVGALKELHSLRSGAAIRGRWGGEKEGRRMLEKAGTGG